MKTVILYRHSLHLFELKIMYIYTLYDEENLASILSIRTVHRSMPSVVTSEHVHEVRHSEVMSILVSPVNCIYEHMSMVEHASCDDTHHSNLLSDDRETPRSVCAL